MALDIETVSELTQEQKEGIALILHDIETDEPFGPGVSAEYSKETREMLRLTRPSNSVVEGSEIYRRLQLVPQLKRKLHELTDGDGIPVFTITGNLNDFKALLDLN